MHKLSRVGLSRVHRVFVRWFGHGAIGSATRMATLSETLDSVRLSYNSKPFMSKYDSFNGCIGEWITYNDFYAHAIGIGLRLIEELGLQTGDRVGICAPNCKEWFMVEHACSLFGFVSIGLPHQSPQNVKDLLKDFNIRVVFSSVAASLSLEPCSSPTVLLDLDQWCSHSKLCASACTSNVGVRVPLLPDHLLHTIILTSGSTGTPKGVKYTRGMWNADMASYPSPSLRAISYLPTSHIVDRHHVSVTMFNGGEVVVVDSLDTVFASLPAINPTILFITPALCDQLLRAESVGNGLRVVVCVAGALQGETAAALTEKWGLEQVVNPYGLTDVGNIAVNGTLLDCVEYKIIPIDDCGDGGGDGARRGGAVLRGELLVKNHFEGYENNGNNSTGAADVVNAEGYFRTGDIVEVDPVTRSVVVCGRIDDRVKLPNGEWVLPSQLEAVVESCRMRKESFPITDIFVETRPGCNTVCAVVHADSGMSTSALFSDAGAPGDESTCRYRFVALINAALEEAGVASRVGQVIVSPLPFTPQNQLRNHSLKLNRRRLRLHFREELDGVFGVHGRECLLHDVAARVAECLAGGLDTSLSDKTFRNLGGDSLLALQVKHFLDTRFGIRDDRLVAALLNTRLTLEAVRATLAARPPPSYVRDEFMKRIAANISTRHNTRADIDDCLSVGDKVLVTGAGGLLGRHVVARLTGVKRFARGSRHPPQVICLVREVTRADAMEMFEGMENVVVVAGDVSLPRLGLSDDEYSRLAAGVTHLVHCAGNTNQSLDLGDLGSNLTSTAEVLLFASQASHIRRTVLLSTTDVLAGGAAEELPLREGHARLSAEMTGYAQMKLREEGVVYDAVCAGLAGVTVCRLGLVCNSSSCPWPQKHDFIDIVFRAVAAAGAVPKLSADMCVPALLPADIAADWVVSLALRPLCAAEPQAACAVYHLTNPDVHKVRYREVFSKMLPLLPVVPLDEWVARVPAVSPLHLLFSPNDSPSTLFGREVTGTSCRPPVVMTRSSLALCESEAEQSPSVLCLVEGVVAAATSQVLRGR